MLRSKYSNLQSYSRTDPLNVYLNHAGVLCHDCQMMMNLQSPGFHHQKHRDSRCFQTIAETATTLWLQPTMTPFGSGAEMDCPLFSHEAHRTVVGSEGGWGERCVYISETSIQCLVTQPNKTRVTSHC